MPVPNIFASATSAIPLSQLDQNFATAITLGNTAVYLGNTTTSLGNVTLTNVTISSGNVSVSTATVGAGSNTAPSITTTGDTNTGIFFPAADTIAFTEGGVESMRIDSAGKVGVGITPSAWLSTSKAMQVGYMSLVDRNLTEAYVGHNFFYNSSNSATYSSTGFSSRIGFYNGTIFFDVAASGTAGNAVSFTQAMTLDADGDLGIGTSSPAFRLDVGGATADVRVAPSTTTNSAYYRCVNASGQAFLGLDNSAGGLGGAYALNIWHSGAYPVVFGTSNTERVRIGASGGLAIQQGLSVGTPTVYLSSIFFASAVLSAGAGTYPLKWNSSTGIVTYDTSSRLVKENIEDSPYGLAEVLQLKSRKYHRTDDQRDEIGLVADEVQTVMPEFVPLVAKSIFTKDEADTELIAGGVNYDKLTSVLVKAIQELKAIVDAQAVEIAALKGTA